MSDRAPSETQLLSTISSFWQWYDSIMKALLFLRAPNQFKKHLEITSKSPLNRLEIASKSP